MATMRKTSARKPKSEEPKAPVMEAEVIKEKKQFKEGDKIPCVSITPGEYLYVGEKSGDLYDWLSDGDEIDMRYDDLVAAVRLKKPCVFKPRIIIKDEDFLEEHPEIQKLYDSMYSKDDLRMVLTLEPKRMADVIKQMPDGAKDAIRAMASQAIDDGTLDSVARVRMLDQVFGTDMLLKLAQ